MRRTLSETRKKRKSLAALASVLALLLIAALAACDGGGSGGGGTDPVAVTGISLNASELTLLPGETYQLTATVTPAEATNSEVTWASADEAIATVDENGLVTMKGSGDTAITVTTVDGDQTASCNVLLVTAGHKRTCTIDATSFTLSYVPGGLTCPTGVNDDGTATVDNAYWIGETEVSYAQWKKVYDWAVANGYTFANAGSRGGWYDGSLYLAYDSGHETHPVTEVNWRDCIVWCNALTEYYNANNGTETDLAPVYCSDAAFTTPIRDSSDGSYGSSVNTAPGSYDAPYVNSAAKGFRLLTSAEWELAVRYRDGVSWTYGDHVSGDESGACYNDGSILGGLGLSTVFGDYAVYDDNSGSSTAEVKSKNANALGLYDMSGNVVEWCFDWYSSSLRVVRGGRWNYTASRLRAGFVYNNYPYDERVYSGFRFSRTR